MNILNSMGMGEADIFPGGLRIAAGAGAGDPGDPGDPAFMKRLKALFDQLSGKAQGTLNNATSLNGSVIADAANPLDAGAAASATKPGMLNQIKGGLSPAFSWLKANPAMGAGLGIAGAANIGGLFDNDKIGGQLGGGALGTAVPMLLNKFAGTALGPAGIALSGLSGGALGSFYDKLRAAQEQKYMQSMSQQGGMY